MFPDSDLVLRRCRAGFDRVLPCGHLTRLDTELFRSIALLLTLLMASAHASASTCDVEVMLDELQSQVTGPLDADQLTSARQILSRHCSEQVASAVAATEQAVRAEPQTASLEEEEKPLTLFGIEFKKAEEGSAGHDRLRKK